MSEQRIPDTTDPWGHAGLGVIVALAVALRVAYAAINPAWQAPDEYPHYWVAAKTAESGRLPAGSPEFPAYESYQPPLYYLLAAGTMALSPSGIIPYGEAPAPVPRDALFARLLSVMLGVLTVVATFRAAVHLGWEPRTSAVAAAFVAFLPSFMGTTASITNDAAVAACSALCLAELLMPGQEWTARTALAVGALFAAALLSKLNALLLLPVVALRLHAVVRERPEDRQTFVVVVLLPVLISLLLMVARNVISYGEPLAVIPWRERAYGVSLEGILWAFRNLAWSFWMAFGRLYEITAAPWVYVATVAPMIGVAALGWLRRGPTARDHEFLVLAMAGIGTGLLLSLLWTFAYPEGTQTSWGKNLFPALPFIALLFAGGWEQMRGGKVDWSGVFLLLLLAGCVWGIAVA